MPETRTNSYEGLFLFPQAATADLQAAVDHIRDILARAGAEIIALRKWDERRLAYSIQGNKRGIYFLVYFLAPADRLSVIERSCNLSEQMLRALITRADHLMREQMEAADAQAELADEIKLRREQPVDATAADDVETEPEADVEDEEDVEDFTRAGRP
jgi:small subunit ribosomal protein S6